MKKDNYYVVAEDNKGDLEMYVNDYIEKGWHPLGGVTTKGNMYYQAMTRVDILCLDPDCLDRQEATK